MFGSSVLSVRVPETGPSTVGLNVTVSSRLVPAGRANGTFGVTVKGPLTEREAMLTVPVPLLSTVTTLGVLVVPTACSPKVSAVALSTRTGFTPLPDSATVKTGLTGSSVVSMRLLAKLPSAWGLNVTVRSLLSPAISENGIVEEEPSMKAVLPLPLKATLEMTMGPVPVLATVTVFVLVVFRRCAPKASGMGLSTRLGFTPLPIKLTATLANSGSWVERVRVPVATASAVGLNFTVSTCGCTRLQRESRARIDEREGGARPGGEAGDGNGASALIAHRHRLP